MLLATTDSLSGVTVERYLGIVVGQAVVGESFTKNYHMGVRDVSVGKVHDYSVELDRAREQATAQMTERARRSAPTP